MDQTVFKVAVAVSALLLLVSMIMAGYRIVRGPSSADRVVALDMLGLLGASSAGIAALVSGAFQFIDIALGIGLIGFLTAVAFAGFISRGSIQEEA